MTTEKELKQITHLTNDEYTFLINYITEKEKQARNKALDEVEKMIKIHIKDITKYRQRYLFISPIHTTPTKDLLKAHIGEVTKFEILLQQLKELREK
jgi:hypothetical protein